jgi:hypothetical protein
MVGGGGGDDDDIYGDDNLFSTLNIEPHILLIP